MAGRPRQQQEETTATVAPVASKAKQVIRYELYPSDEKLIPSDENGVKRAPYPALKGIPNAGEAINPKTGNLEAWRYVHGYQKSIWVSEQPHLTSAQINDQRNELIFRKGILQVQPFETAKIQALEIQDGFNECKNPVNGNRPKIYFRIDQEKHNQAVLEDLDLAYEAEKKAREMSNEEMYALASLFAIELDQSDNSIRTQLIVKSKETPRAFIREYQNPRTKIRFLFLRALQDNLITERDGQLIWVDTNTPQFNVRKGVDLPEELSLLWASNNKEVRALAKTLNDMVEA